MAPIKSFAGKLAKAAFAASAATRRGTSIASHHRRGERSLGTLRLAKQMPGRLSAATTDGGAAARLVPAGSTAETISAGDISSFCLSRMCELFGAASPADDGLHLSITGGERGVRLCRPAKRGDVLLSIPIASCFRDDEPPRWYEQRTLDDGGAGSAADDGGEYEHDITDYERYNPSAWASRLAASLLDMELIPGRGQDAEDAPQSDLTLGREIWQSMLPDKDKLRASLPVHWGEEVLATSKCTALDLAVDSAYFARAGAVTNLSEELKRALDWNQGAGGDMTDQEMLQRKCDADALDIALDMETLQKKCHHALDIVQTRACRVERKCEDGVQWGPPLRVIAPIFDFLNHGPGRAGGGHAGDGAANASFGVEDGGMCDVDGARLVVRALRDVAGGEEVLVDYGDAARPAWRCLTSYGFVPERDAAGPSGADDEGGGDAGDAEDVAELWMNGRRFEVDPHSVPYDLVEVAAARVVLDDPPAGADRDAGGGALTPAVARAIAKRATEAAFNLITEPETVDSEEDWDSPRFVHASSLASQLRWSQHRVLLAFAKNLELFSSSPSGEE